MNSTSNSENALFKWFFFFLINPPEQENVIYGIKYCRNSPENAIVVIITCASPSSCRFIKSLTRCNVLAFTLYNYFRFLRYFRMWPEAPSVTYTSQIISDMYTCTHTSRSSHPPRILEPFIPPAPANPVQTPPLQFRAILEELLRRPEHDRSHVFHVGFIHICT